MSTEITEKAALQAQKWEQLRHLLQDPEISAFLAREFSSNGNAIPSSVYGVPSSANQKRNKKGLLIKAVTTVC